MSIFKKCTSRQKGNKRLTFRSVIINPRVDKLLLTNPVKYVITNRIQSQLHIWFVILLHIKLIFITNPVDRSRKIEKKGGGGE